MKTVDDIVSEMRSKPKGIRFVDLSRVCEQYDHYTYRVTWSEEDGEFVGLCAEFPGLSWLASAPEDALRGVRSVVADVVEDMNEQKEPVPEPLASRSFSGKFMIRVPPHVHRELAVEAAEAGVSLNRLASAKLTR